MNMESNKPKFKLSPRLSKGIGRSYKKNNFLTYSSLAFIIISIGLGVWTASLIFSDNNPAIESRQPQVLGVEDTQTVEPFINYQIISGDTIYNIGKKYNLDWTIIASLNNLSPPFNLKIGDSLQIPTDK